ncbi:MAG: hypothetical protein U1F27_09215 [Turneriella sp.]
MRFLPIILVAAVLPLYAAEEPQTIRTEKPGRITKTITTGGRKNSTFLFSPESDDPGWIFGAGLRMTIIPKRIAESETRFFPIVEGYLNKNFLKYLQWRNALGVLYLQNYASTGLFGVARGRWLSVSVGNSLAVWGGVFKSSGFDALTATIVTHPTFSIGFNSLSHYYYWLPDSLSITYKVNILHNRYQRLGNSIYQEKSFTFEGFSVLLMAEYYTGKGGIYIGLQINHAKPGYEFWLAFSDYDRFFQYTTLFAGYRF